MGQTLQISQQYEVDVPLLRELRAIQEQTARELGQLHDKHEQSDADRGDFVGRLKRDHQRMAALKQQRLAASERTS